MDLANEMRQLKADMARRVAEVGPTFAHHQTIKTADAGVESGVERELEAAENTGIGGEDVDDRVNGSGDDVGIGGLTIVLHLKNKDDLVISTDLTTTK